MALGHENLADVLIVGPTPAEEIRQPIMGLLAGREIV